MSAAESIVPSSNLQEWFAPFRRHIIGIDQDFESPYGTRRRQDFFVRHLHGHEPRWK